MKTNAGFIQSHFVIGSGLKKGDVVVGLKTATGAAMIGVYPMPDVIPNWVCPDYEYMVLTEDNQTNVNP
jgi:hypothetical protein